MPDLTLAGRPVLDATIALPRVGAWLAVVHVDDADVPAGAATLASADGALEMHGTIRRGGAFQERGRVELVGGGGGLAGEVAPRFYANAPARQVLSDLLRDAGESLSATADGPLLGTLLPAWPRARGAAGAALATLLDALGATWRVLADGSIWVGRETWPTIDPVDVELLDDDPSDGAVVVAADVVRPEFVPGTTYLERRVGLVRHEASSARVRTEVLFDIDGEGDRLGGALEATIRYTMRGVDWHALYPAAVRAQAADGTLSVAPDSPALPAMTGVPIRLGIPGVRVTVDSTARCLVGFEGGDPRYPAALLWRAEGLTELKLGTSATRGAARMDDSVNAGTLTATAGATPVTFVYTPAGGLPGAPSATALLTGGKISSASALVKIQ
jgi:hypothetical protein